MELQEKRLNRLGELKEIVAEGIPTFIKVATALAEIRSEKLWELDGYGSFESFCRSEFNFGRSHGYELAKAGDVLSALQSGAPDSLPTSGAQVRELARAETPEQQREAWEMTLETTDNQPTAPAVAAAVSHIQARETQQKATSGSKAVVVAGKHDGAEVEVVGVAQQGKIIKARVPGEKKPYPFMPGELKITEPAAPAKPKVTQRQLIEQLRSVLRRILKGGLTAELRREAQALLE